MSRIYNREDKFGLRDIESQLGVKFAESFIIESSCLDTLQCIEESLAKEDRETRNYRCQLFQHNIVEKCLVPIVEFIDDDQNDMVSEKEEIFSLSLKLLAHLSQTYDCLTPQHPHYNCRWQQEVSNTTKFTINKLVAEIHAQFTNTHIIQVIQEKVLAIIEMNKMTESHQMMINSALFLYRNLFYYGAAVATVKQIKLFHLLLSNDLKEMVLFCVRSPEKDNWVLSLVQLITLIFQDAENSLNTTVFKLRDCEEDMADDMKSDICTVVAPSDIESCDTIVNTDPVQSVVLVKKLQDFAKELLENGWPELIYGVKTLLVTKNSYKLSSLYYAWNIKFTVTMAKTYSLHFNTVKSLLSPYVVDYLIFSAVQATEHLQAVSQVGDIANMSPDDVAEMANQLMNAVNGINCVLDLIEHYWTSQQLAPQDRQHLLQTKCMLSLSSDLRMLSVLLHRHYNADVMCLDYLKALVHFNNLYLTMVQGVQDMHPNVAFFDMRQHIASFANKDVIQMYGELFLRYDQCCTTTLEYAFTMLYHMTVDMGKPDLLLHLPLLKAFSEIDDSSMGTRLSQLAVDVMRLAFDYFYHQGVNDSRMLATTLTSGLQRNEEKTSDGQTSDSEDSYTTLQEEDERWKEGDIEELAQIAMEMDGSLTFIDDVVTALRDRGIEHNVDDIIFQLKKLQFDTGNSDKDSDDEECNMDDDNKHCHSSPPGGDTLTVPRLVEHLKEEGHSWAVAWIQNCILDTVYVHLGGANHSASGATYPEEPVTMQCVAAELSIPLVAYTHEQLVALQNSHLSLLLEKLELQPPDFAKRQIFPRIPSEWDIAQLWDKACQLGDVVFEEQKFSKEALESHLEKYNKLEMEKFQKKQDLDSQNSHGVVSSDNVWLFYVKGNKSTNQEKDCQLPWWQRSKTKPGINV